jgi:two-component sensor histidine kinase
MKSSNIELTENFKVIIPGFDKINNDFLSSEEMLYGKKMKVIGAISHPGNITNSVLYGFIEGNEKMQEVFIGKAKSNMVISWINGNKFPVTIKFTPIGNLLSLEEI